MLCLGKVEWATIGLGRSCYHIDNEGDNRGDVACKDKPTVLLCLNKTSNRHCAGKAHNGEHRDTNREFIADHLSTTTHGAYHCVLAVARPSGKQDTYYAKRRHGGHEENTDVKVYGLQSLAPWQASKHHHRCHQHEIWRQFMEEIIGLPQAHHFLDEHFYHVGKNLQRTPRAHTQRTAAALEPGAHPTLIHDVEHGKHGVGQQQ